MSLETQLTEALNGIGWLSDMHVETDDDFDADVVHAVTERLASLAHDGVLVVDFRTDSAGEVLRLEQEAWLVGDLPGEFDYVPYDADDTWNYPYEPLFVLVRPNDGSDQSSPPNTETVRCSECEVMYQCARCGSSLEWDDCATCEACGVGYGEDADPDCPTCEGAGRMSTCLSTPEWCKAHPLPGRDQVERHTAEDYIVPCAVHLDGSGSAS